MFVKVGVYMKKITNYVLVFVMLFTYFSPFFEIFDIKAEENIDEEISTVEPVSKDKYSLVGIDDEENYLVNMEPNQTKSITIDTEEDYHINGCYSYYGDFLTTSMDFESDACVITADNYGKAYVILEVANSDYSSIVQEYFYVDVNLDEYINLVMDRIPNEINGSTWEYLPDHSDISLYIYGDKCTKEGNKEICDAEFSYHYSIIEGEKKHVSPYVKTKKITRIIPADKFSIGVSSLYMDVEETQEIYLNNYNGSYEDLIWVSENNNVATVDQNGVVTGVGKGNTNIRLYNKNTFEYASLEMNVKEPELKTEEQIKSALDNKTITLDINHKNGVYNPYWDEEYILRYTFENYLQRNFSEKISSNLSYNGIKNFVCENNVCDFTFTYTDYNDNYRQKEIDLSNVTIDLKGIYIYNNHIYSVDNEVIVNYKTYLPENADVTFIYDNEYLEEVSEGIYRSIKAGSAEIKIISEGYSDTQKILIKHGYEDEEVLNNYLESLKNIELPYSSSIFSDKDNLIYLEHILKEKIVAGYPDSTLRKNIIANVSCLNANMCNVSIYNDEGTFGDRYSKTLINVSYTNTDTETINEIKRIDNLIEPSYLIDLNSVIRIENACNGLSECVYDSLINYTNLNSILGNSNLTINYSIIDTFEFKDRINGGANYLVTISNDSGKLYTKVFTIQSNHIVTMPAKLDKNKRSEYLKEYVDSVLDADTSNELLYDNVYKITNGNNTFNLILDQKDKVDIQSVSVTDRVFELKVGQSKEIKYQVYPSNATMGDVIFEVEDSSVATVDENGVITAKSKGYTFVECIVGYSSNKILITVDMTIKDVLNSFLPLIDKHQIVDYSNLRYYPDIENVLSNTISSNFYSNNHSWLPLNIKVKQENNKYYAAISYNASNYYDDVILSDYKEVTYETKGIKLDKYHYEINTNDVVDTKLFFSEGDNNNLYFSYEKEGIVELRKDGTLKPLKTGATNIYIQDKYNKYWNNITVVVNIDEYINNFEKTLKAKPITINAIDFVYSYNDITNIVSGKINSLINFYAMNKSTSLQCDEEKLNCKLQIFNANQYGSQVFKEYTFNVKKEGIYLDSNLLELNLNESKDVKYTLINDTGNVKVKSLNNDICEIKNNKIVGTGIGFCTIKYTSDKYINYQHVIVGKESIINGYQTILSNINNLEVPILDFDARNSKLSENMYETLEETIQYASVRNKIMDLIGNSTEYYVNAPYGINDYNNVRVSVNPYYNFRDPKNNYYYNHSISAQGISESISVVPTKIDKEDLEIGNRIVKKTIQNTYQLSLFQYLKYRLSGKSMKLIEYSDFYEMLEEECPTCTYMLTQGGGGGDEGHISEGGSYVIFKNNNPIAVLNLSFEANIKIMQENAITSEDEYINLIKEMVKEAYLKAKKESTPVARFTPVSYSVRNLSDDLDIQVEKGFSSALKKMVYTITVEDITFTTAINNEISGDAKYTYSVTEIKPNKNEITLDKGLNAIIGYTITPDKATNKEVTFKSSDESIVTVDSKGNISAKKAGEAYITITSKDGNASTKVKVIVNDKEVASAEIKLGDINCDGKINMTDIIRLRKYLAGKETLNNQSLKNGDINKDGKINMTDIIKLRKYLAGKEKL